MVKTLIIAEIAASHNGDLDLAKALIRAAAASGCDLAKFQDWRAANVADSDSDKKRYEAYQFPDAWYPILIPYCRERGVEFLTSVFNVDRVKTRAGYGLKKIKIASVCLTNTDLLMLAGANFEEVILSTAMATREEIEEAADVLASNCKKFTLMACTANYPMDAKDANLARIDELKKMLEGQEYATVGYSDHALDLDVAKAALAQGVSYLEKHFSLSRFLPQTAHTMHEGGTPLTTHAVSIEPHELRELADWRDKVAVMEGVGSFKSNDVELAIKQRYLNRYGV